MNKRHGNPSLLVIVFAIHFIRQVLITNQSGFEVHTQVIKVEQREGKTKKKKQKKKQNEGMA